MTYINGNRLKERIKLLSHCSIPSKGVTRLAFTKESLHAEELVIQWMEQAQMMVRRDEMNNIIGRYEGENDQLPVLMIGSHLDSVVDAGMFDGILGVVSAIEVIQFLSDKEIVPPYPIEVVSFCDEEGTRFHTTFLGSKAIAGTLTDSDLEKHDDQGCSIAEALQEIGLDPTLYTHAKRNVGDLLGYIELHIEQGPVLQENNLPCGVVTEFAGASRFNIRIEGKAGHAGTVPFANRKDALTGAAEAILFLEKIAKTTEGVMATVGKLSVQPGASNVIPGSVTFTLDVRDVDEKRKQNFVNDAFRKIRGISLNRGLLFHHEEVLTVSPVKCSNEYITIIENVLKDNSITPLKMVSGAGHDAMAVSDIAKVGMIFVRCKDGISHHPDEFVSIQDMKIGTKILLDTVLKITCYKGDVIID
ncbi:Zn-dependent hydrolase [Metabacillus litoralis]|uniref:Zn-dependent hydrolase n=1 Tax=Metabacillus litoralis TaxID=152268 RepID=UPI001F011226|nr:Zn-dependent hydrolase [Metabacillus litoralis]